MSQDFFSQALGATAVAMPAATPGETPLQDFARAIDCRMAPALVADPLPTRPLAALRLSSASPAKAGPSTASTMQPPAPPSEFRALAPSELSKLVGRSSVLVLDIRSNASYASARLATALSLSVPSTLLKRPAFSLQKLSTMMCSTSRDRFLMWPSAATIIVYDADTASLVDGNNVLGLLRKFKAAGYQGEIAWIRGGFTAVWKSARDLVSQAPLPDDSESGEDSPSSSPLPGGLLRAQNLSMSAFQQSSTTGAARTAGTSSAVARSTTGGASPQAYVTTGAAAPPTSTRVTAANPFFDNIRQNVELAQGITERIPLKLAPHVSDRAKRDLPFQWLRDIVSRSEEEEADILAMQFYKIELGEQRRMQGVMEHHTKNAFSTTHGDFPYSISAAIEKGTKNRYRDIYPFEHSRVRLRSPADCDYVNANYIRPLGTDKRYIATQGPLPSTYNDFWTLCWEQNVSVIVMLTRQVEGAHLKCGSYWSDQQFGSLRLQQISVEGPSDDAELNVQNTGAFDFGIAKEEPTKKFDPSTSIIQRKFWLTHDGHRDVKPRLVTQFQYLGWPDVNVPEDADGLLWLINAVNEAAAAAANQSPRHARAASPPASEPSPILLHCSAGVGRTGAFIAVDAVLDALRQEMRGHLGQVSADTTSGSSRAATPSSSSRLSPKTTAGSSKESSISAAKIPQLNSKAFNLALPVSSKSGERFNSRSGSTSSVTNGYSSNPRVFDSAGVTTASSSSATSDDVVMSDKDTGGDVPPSDDALSEPEVDPHAMDTPSVQAMAQSAGDGAYFHGARIPQQDATMAGLEVHSTTAFDYASPRGSALPQSRAQISSLDEPVREVLDDMRKQRMSLCQSLRQYVFVHRAIIEGALALVDQEQALRSSSSSPSLSAKNIRREDSLTKRPSLKRKQRSMPDEDAPLGRSQRGGAVRQ